MSTQRHGETQSPLEGLEARIEAGFEWLQDRPRQVVLTLAALVLVGVAAALAYEWSERSEAAAHAALDRVERDFLRAMGGAPTDVFATEPANEERARAAREEALAGFEAVIADHSGRVAARVADIRAAEMELGLERLEAAAERLGAGAAALDEDDPLRAVALRLRAYVLEELGRFEEAGQSYREAASVESYPAHEALWLAAGESFLQAGDTESARLAFREVLSLAPAFAERQGLVDRLAALEAAAAAPSE